jgi:hypothetical protein
LPGFGSGNRACQFNGAAGYVNVPGTFLNLTNSMSLIAWVQPGPANGLTQCILGKGTTSYRLELNGNGVPQFADGTSNAPARAQNRIDDGAWHQLVGVYDNPGSGSNYLYLDGELAASSAAPLTPEGNSLDLRLGGAPDSGTMENFSGSIDEVALFTNALTGAQVRELYLTATNSAALSPQPPLFQSSQLSAGSLLYSWNVAQGLRYQLQYKTNLAEVEWSNFRAAITATGTVMSVSIPVGPDRQRFYRTVLLP